MEGSLRNARILVVEDDRDSLELVKITFETSGFTNVRSTMDPREVVAIFESDPPDILLLDLHMPHIGGLAVIEEITKFIPSGPFLPIVLISGDISREVKDRALEVGASEFLLKPYEMTQLIDVVESSLTERFASLQRTPSEADR